MQAQGQWLVLAILAATAVRAAQKECVSFRECISLGALHSTSSPDYAATMYKRVCFPLHVCLQSFVSHVYLSLVGLCCPLSP